MINKFIQKNMFIQIFLFFPFQIMLKMLKMLKIS